MTHYPTTGPTEDGNEAESEVVADVVLKWDEVRLAVYAGVDRYIADLAGNPGAFSEWPPTADRHINDALSEWAVAKHLNVFPTVHDSLRPGAAVPGLWKGTLVGVEFDGLANAVEPNDARGRGPGNPT